MPRAPYAELIQESAAELRREEKRLRGAATQPRIRMLRLLKAGQITSLHASTSLLGSSLSQLYRWWATYRQGGLAHLLESHPRPVKPAKLTPRLGRGSKLRCGRGGSPPSGMPSAICRSSGPSTTASMGSGTTCTDGGPDRRPGDGCISRRMRRAKQPIKADFGVFVRDHSLSRVWAMDEGRFWAQGLVSAPLVSVSGAASLDRGGSLRVALALPAYSPELNPAERIFEHLRAKLANRIFADLSDLEESVIQHLQSFWAEPTVLRQLTSMADG